MRVIGLILVGIFFCSGCKKEKNNNSTANSAPESRLVILDGEHPTSSIIDYKTCSRIEYKGEHVQLCFDSLIEDSRCPSGVECVWAGAAIAKFSFSVNQDQHPVTLSTLDLHVFPSDTTLMGYKIAFINLSPYPDININHDLSDYKAELRISKQ